MTDKGKLIIISAPSGCGKSTIIGDIMDRGQLDLQFSVSATNRKPREGEVDGVNYHFLTDQQFKDLIADGAFVEYEQVYPGRFYGTLRSEVERIWADGHVIVFDVDVIGGLNLRRIFGDDACAVFIMPPSVEELRRRLESRGTDAPEVIDRRVAKAEFELTKAQGFDHIVLNDRLDEAIEETACILENFIGIQR